MEKFSSPIQIRWADIDANRHLRHSVYFDYGAMVRVQFLSAGGLTTNKFEALKIGPILFREEAIFKREVRLEDELTVSAEITRMTQDCGRWSLRHHFMKADGTIAAVLNVDGAWIDLEKRKLAMPGEFIRSIFGHFPKGPDFEWIIRDQK
jgi:acyl-CoA thioester hydrolase